MKDKEVVWIERKKKELEKEFIEIYYDEFILFCRSKYYDKNVT